MDDEMGSEYCVFCYKVNKTARDDEDSESRSSSGGDRILNTFAERIRRQFRIPVSLNEFITERCDTGNGQLPMKPCLMCVSVVSKFNDLYHELKCTELKMQLEMSKLLDVMRSAGKVSSRKSQLKTAFGNEAFQNLQTDRRNWIQSCSKGLLECFPRIKLRNIKPKAEMSFDTGDFTAPEQISTKLLISVCVIGMLLVDQSQPCSTGDYFCDQEDDYEELTTHGNKVKKDADTSLAAEQTAISDVEMADCYDDDDRACESLEEDKTSCSSNFLQKDVTAEETEGVHAPDEPEIDRPGKENLLEEQEAYKLEANNEIKTSVSLESVTRHRKFRKRCTSRKLPPPLSLTCKICKSGRIFTSYSCLAKHRKSLSHRLAMKTMNKTTNEARRLPGSIFTTKSIKTELPTEETSEAFSSSFENAQQTKDMGYNLRRRPPPPSREVVSSYPDVGSEEDYEKSDDKSYGSSSTSTDDSEPETDDVKPFLRKKTSTSQTFRCKVQGCKFYTSSDSGYESHVKLHELGTFPCSFCADVSTTPIDLSLHELKHSGKSRGREYKCPRCPYVTVVRNVYASHFAREHLKLSVSLPTYTCSICKLEYTSHEKHLAYHKSQGSRPEKVLKCPVENCGATVSSRYTLRRHQMEIHSFPELSSVANDDVDAYSSSEENQLKCKHCGKIFRAQVRLRRHLFTYHNKVTASVKVGSRLKLTCPVTHCAKLFDFQKELEMHSKLHGSWTCAKCEFEAGFLPELMEHEIDCLNLGAFQRYKCPDPGCVFIAKKKSTLVDHRLDTHLGATRKVFACELCSTRFLTVNKRRGHRKVCQGRADGKGSVPCKNCNKLFRSEKELEIHSKYHGKWTCQFCPVEEQFAPDLALHELETHGTSIEEDAAKTRCSRCSWSGKKGQCSNRNGYVNHFVSAHLQLNTKMYLCEICQASFDHHDDRSSHIRRNHRRKSKSDCYKCDKCPAFFTTVHGLVCHIRRIHKKKTGFDLVCVQCGESYNNEHSLRNHVKVKHKNLNTFSCDEPKCGRSFCTETELLIHKEAMCSYLLNMTELTCEICGKTCRGEQGLKNHMRVHAQKRPTEWKCGTCGKEFNTKCELQMHELYHQGPEHWRFMCSICSKKSTTKAKLEEHMRSHSKEKPFVCQVCGEKYAHKHNLQGHIKRKHKEVELHVRKQVQRPGVSRKGKKLGVNFCFTKEKDTSEGGN